ncbi:hypothetical protein EJ03DRAFT_345601 [Teratosphaeria nubilosa]|uniref:Uncharacterized protein n=1 Tax=Teratosphaeria nubilosa TaxID=161662 RepID=A0A6G1KY44_9PEZI|nr:hypothetical protein EJ03DRAFT_345601 [Teratosphaeria nubilosa]
MPSDKPRLYVALYPSGTTNNEERKYHWAFLGWKYEEVGLKNVRSTITLLTRILIAKVEYERRLVEIMRSQPVIQDDPNWRCRTWIASVLKELARDGKAVGTSQLDWETVEATARQCVASKTADGRYQRYEDLLKRKPTWDMLEIKETMT